MKKIAMFSIMSLFLATTAVNADDGIKAILHVTSVHSEVPTDWCTTGKCQATRYIVEGYTAASVPNLVIRYVLDCVEVVTVPGGEVTVGCVKPRAGADYDVKVFPTSIYIPPAQPTSVSHYNYNIRSQKEEKK